MTLLSYSSHSVSTFPTIQIGGDTTKLQTALKGVNSSIKDTQSQLKDVEKLLKMDPGNVELLSQKQKLLADAVSKTKEKLTTLKTAAEQMNTALANGDVSQEQYDALLQKTYTVDVLTQKRVVNNGIVPQYYVENNHEAIIPRDLYMQVQEELVRRANLRINKDGTKRVYSSKYPLSSRLYCDTFYSIRHSDTPPSKNGYKYSPDFF